MSKFNLKWTLGNQKLEKLDTVGFGIPAYQSRDGFKTCPMAGACAAVCYARQGNYTFPTVRNAREFNLSESRAAGFAGKAIADLAKIPNGIVRVHDSGDFYSQEYLNAWIEIARAFPGKRFYAYTKSLHLDYSSLPPNFNVVQSMGGKLDSKLNTGAPHSRIFSTHADRKRAGYADGSKTDSHAIKGTVKIGLVHHGRALTDAQKAYFA